MDNKNNPQENILFILGQISQKLDYALQRSEEDRREHRRLADRVAQLERWKWAMQGAAAVSGGTVSFVITKIFT